MAEKKSRPTTESAKPLHTKETRLHDVPLGRVSVEHFDVQRSRARKPIEDRMPVIRSMAARGWDADSVPVLGLMNEGEVKESLSYRLATLKGIADTNAPDWTVYGPVWIKPERFAEVSPGTVQESDLIVPDLEPRGGQQRTHNVYDARRARVMRAFPQRTTEKGKAVKDAFDPAGLPETMDGLEAIPNAVLREYASKRDAWLDEVRLNTARDEGAINYDRAELLAMAQRVMDDGGSEADVQRMFPLSTGERSARQYCQAILTAREFGVDLNDSESMDRLIKKGLKLSAYRGAIADAKRTLSLLPRGSKTKDAKTARTAQQEAESAIQAIIDGTAQEQRAVSVKQWGELAAARPSNRVAIELAYAQETGNVEYIGALLDTLEGMDSPASINIPATWLKRREITPEFSFAGDEE